MFSTMMKFLRLLLLLEATVAGGSSVFATVCSIGLLRVLQQPSGGVCENKYNAVKFNFFELKEKNGNQFMFITY